MKLYGQTARIAWRAPSFGARYQSTVAPRRSRLKVGAAPFFLNAPPIEDSEGGSTLSFIQSTTALAPPATPVAVRSRYGLPGAARPATNTMLPEFLAAPSADFPKVIDAAPLASAHDSASRWAKALHGELDRLLPRHGAVVVHGLEEVVGNVEGFTRFMAAIKAQYACNKFMEGRSMTSTQMTDLVRTGSDDHAAYTIEPHNEYMVASKHRPRKLFLVCSVEPTHGGEWPLTDGAALLAAIPDDIKARFEARGGVRYEVWYPSDAPGVYNHWQGNIGETRDAAEAYLGRTGCDWDWHEDGSLLIHRTMPAISPHPETDEPCWFNQIHAHHRTFYEDCHPDFDDKDLGTPWPVHTKYGDGTEIPDDDIARIRKAVWENSVAVPLKKGMLLVVDNYKALHGRMGYTPGTPRQALVSIIYE